MKYTTLQILNKSPTTTTTIIIHCSICNKLITELGYVYINPANKQKIEFLCSVKCKNEFKKYITRHCLHCKTEIDKYDSGNRKYCSIKCKQDSKTFICLACGKVAIDPSSRRNTKRKYCSRMCAKAFGSYKYNTHYYCDMCITWIKREDAKEIIINTKKFFGCPTLSCNNNKLKTQGRNTKHNRKRRGQDVKRIE